MVFLNKILTRLTDAYLTISNTIASILEFDIDTVLGSIVEIISSQLFTPNIIMDGLLKQHKQMDI